MENFTTIDLKLLAQLTSTEPNGGEPDDDVGVPDTLSSNVSDSDCNDSVTSDGDQEQQPNIQTNVKLVLPTTAPNISPENNLQNGNKQETEQPIQVHWCKSFNGHDTHNANNNPEIPEKTQKNVDQNATIPDQHMELKTDKAKAYRKKKKRRNRFTKQRFHCDICSRDYSSKKSLTVHTRLHTGERPFGCSECTKKFTSRAGLNSHVKIHYSNKVRPYSCPICMMGFKLKRSVGAHVKRHEENQIRCELCNERFENKWELSGHLIIHKEIFASLASSSGTNKDNGTSPSIKVELESGSESESELDSDLELLDHQKFKCIAKLKTKKYRNEVDCSSSSSSSCYNEDSDSQDTVLCVKEEVGESETSDDEDAKEQSSSEDDQVEIITVKKKEKVVPLVDLEASNDGQSTSISVSSVNINKSVNFLRLSDNTPLNVVKSPSGHPYGTRSQSKSAISSTTLIKIESINDDQDADDDMCNVCSNHCSNCGGIPPPPEAECSLYSLQKKKKMGIITSKEHDVLKAYYREHSRRRRHVLKLKKEDGILVREPKRVSSQQRRKIQERQHQLYHSVSKKQRAIRKEKRRLQYLNKSTEDKMTLAKTRKFARLKLTEENGEIFSAEKLKRDQELARKRELERRRYHNRTPEEKIAWLSRRREKASNPRTKKVAAAKQKIKRSQMTHEEQQVEKLKVMMRTLKKVANMTPNERDKVREQQKLHQRKYIRSLTPDKLQALRQKARETRRKRLGVHKEKQKERLPDTPENLKRRLHRKLNKGKGKKRSEEYKQLLEQGMPYWKARYQLETPQQRENRLSNVRINKKIRKLRKKQVKSKTSVKSVGAAGTSLVNVD